MARVKSCKGCKALPLNKSKGVCLLGKEFVTYEGAEIPKPRAFNCRVKSRTKADLEYHRRLIALFK